MARSPKRRVKRNSGGRQDIMQSIAERSWYELPDWAVVWLVKYGSRMMFALVLLLSPIAVLAVVLGSHALPLQVVGIAGSDNSLGLKAALFLVSFACLAFAVRPLRRGLRHGWWLVIAASGVHVVNNVVSGEGFSGIVLLALACYLYAQVRPRLE